jgi:hypothetical protein
MSAELGAVKPVNGTSKAADERTLFHPVEQDSVEAAMVRIGNVTTTTVVDARSDWDSNMSPYLAPRKGSAV